MTEKEQPWCQRPWSTCACGFDAVQYTTEFEGQSQEAFYALVAEVMKSHMLEHIAQEVHLIRIDLHGGRSWVEKVWDLPPKQEAR